VDAVVTDETSEKTKSSNPLAIAAIRMSLLGQDPEGYAKACAALAEAKELDFASLEMVVSVVTGSEDKISQPQLCKKDVEVLKGRASLQVLEGVGHWHVFEDLLAVAKAVEEALS